MPIPSNIATSIEDRTRQIVLFVREIKIIAQQIVNKIDGVNGNQLFASDLLAKSNSLANIRAMLPPLVDARTRARLLEQYPNNFANAAAVNADIGAANTALIGLINELKTLAGTIAVPIIDTDATGYQTSPVITSPASDSLRANAAAVIASID